MQNELILPPASDKQRNIFFVVNAGHRFKRHFSTHCMLIEKGAELHRPKCHVTSPTEVRVRSGPQSRHVRIARLRAADNPDAVVGLQGLLNGGTHIAERIGRPYRSE